jgi:hypothetical protein
MVEPIFPQTPIDAPQDFSCVPLRSGDPLAQKTSIHHYPYHGADAGLGDGTGGRPAPVRIARTM